MLADFHITPEPITSDNESRDQSTDLTQYDMPSILPTQISYYTGVRTYNMIQYTFNTDTQQTTTTQIKQERETTGRSDRKKRERTITFHTTEIPQYISTDEIQYVNQDCMQQIQQLYNTQRAIYLRASIVELLQSQYNKDDIHRCINLYAYTYTSGPWRSSFVRNSYDPRIYVANDSTVDNMTIWSSATVMKWQIIDFRVPPDDWLLIQQHRSNKQHSTTNSVDNSPNNSEDDSSDDENVDDTKHNVQTTDRNTDIHFRSIPHSKITQYQLCEIDDTEIQNIIDTAHCQTTCDLHTGYFDATTFESIRTRMKQLIRQRMESIGIDISILNNKQNMNTIAEQMKQARLERKKLQLEQKQHQSAQKQHKRIKGINKRETERAQRKIQQQQRDELRKQKQLNAVEASELEAMAMLPQTDLDEVQREQVNAAVRAVMTPNK